MGLADIFWLNNPAKQRARDIQTGAVVAPTRAERTACWAARDRLFACLDASGGEVSAGGEATAEAASCGRESAELDAACAAEWAAHFRRWRVAQARRNAVEAELKARGARRIELSPDFAVTAGPATAGPTGPQLAQMADAKRRPAQ